MESNKNLYFIVFLFLTGILVIGGISISNDLKNHHLNATKNTATSYAPIKSASLSQNMNLSSSDGSFFGENAGDSAGNAVAGGGDVNGDGYDDILIGAYNGAGKVYLIFGNESSSFSPNLNLSNADITFYGESPFDSAGISVAVVGDVNNDGYDDILIGANSYDKGVADVGKVYLIFGKESSWPSPFNLSDADASFYGEYYQDRLGVSLAGAGDVNNDGFDDILIGSNVNDMGGDRAGKAYLIFGRNSPWKTDVNITNANSSFYGEASEDFAGYDLAGAGDVNNDGYDDILIGAYGNDMGGSSAGKVYLIFGNESNTFSPNVNLTNIKHSFIGEASGDLAGFAVAGAGDVNKDGYADLLIGARYNDEGADNSAGQTYLIFGNVSSTFKKNVDLGNVDASFIGEGANDQSGVSLSGAGDINKDGYADFLIGAQGNDDGLGDNTGKIYVIFGKKSNSFTRDRYLSDDDVSFIGEAPEDGAGGAIAIAGDVNGDGYDDILIGAEANDYGGNNAGKAYLIFGEGQDNNDLMQPYLYFILFGGIAAIALIGIIIVYRRKKKKKRQNR